MNGKKRKPFKVGATYVWDAVGDGGTEYYVEAIFTQPGQGGRQDISVSYLNDEGLWVWHQPSVAIRANYRRVDNKDAD